MLKIGDEYTNETVFEKTYRTLSAKYTKTEIDEKYPAIREKIDLGTELLASNCKDDDLYPEFTEEDDEILWLKQHWGQVHPVYGDCGFSDTELEIYFKKFYRLENRNEIL